MAALVFDVLAPSIGWARIRIFVQVCQKDTTTSSIEGLQLPLIIFQLKKYYIILKAYDK